MDDPASLLLLLLADPALAADAPAITTSVLNIFLVVVLVAANGFFVASEFALVAVRRSRIESQAAEGNRAAVRLAAMLRDLNAYISATQLGITLSSLGLGWIGEPAVASMITPLLASAGEMTGVEMLATPAFIHALSFALAFSFITFLHIVFGELAPKTAALELSERIAYAVALPLLVFYKIFYYPIRLLDWAGTKTVRIAGLKGSDAHGASYTEEEIKQVLNVSFQSGHLNEEESKLINQIFEFSDTTVKEAMIPRTEITAVPDESTLEHIAAVFNESGYSRLPVYRGSLDDIVGFVHSKDLVKYVGAPETFALDDILIRPNYVVDTARLEDVLRQMQTEKFHFGFVVDEHGGVEGIITLEDLLEEIVGDISDEHDEEVNQQMIEQGDGSFILDGGIAVRDLNKRLGSNLPVSESYTTIAGLMMAESGRLLEPGESVRLNGHLFEVEAVDKRRILRVRMTKA